MGPGFPSWRRWLPLLCLLSLVPVAPLGGEIQVLHKPGMSHHPHGLDDPTPVVDFVLRHAATKTPAP
jgi:hypothetical protein